MIEEEFKNYQRALNEDRLNKLAEAPLPTKRPLLEPDIHIKVDVSDLVLEEIPINIKIEVPEPKPEPKIDSKSIVLF